MSAARPAYRSNFGTFSTMAQAWHLVQRAQQVGIPAVVQVIHDGSGDHYQVYNTASSVAQRNHIDAQVRRALHIHTQIVDGSTVHPNHHKVVIQSR